MRGANPRSLQSKNREIKKWISSEANGEHAGFSRRMSTVSGYSATARPPIDPRSVPDAQKKFALHCQQPFLFVNTFRSSQIAFEPVALQGLGNSSGPWAVPQTPAGCFWTTCRALRRHCAARIRGTCTPKNAIAKSRYLAQPFRHKLVFRCTLGTGDASSATASRPNHLKSVRGAQDRPALGL